LWIQGYTKGNTFCRSNRTRKCYLNNINQGIQQTKIMIKGSDLVGDTTLKDIRTKWYNIKFYTRYNYYVT